MINICLNTKQIVKLKSDVYLQNVTHSDLFSLTFDFQLSHETFEMNSLD